MAGRLQVIQKLPDPLRCQVFEVERIDRSMCDLAQKSKQQLERIAIGRHRMRTDVSFGGEIADEESCHQGREIGGRHDGLLSVMR